MKNALINDITRRMVPVLDNHQLMQLQEVLAHCLWEVEVVPREEKSADVPDNAALLAQFIAAKRVEGCSEKTLKYYRTTITHLLEAVSVSVTRLQTDDLRRYLAEYQARRGCSKGNIDNIRRILSSFFAWLEDENIILKSPVRRIRKIKSTTTVKETYSDEALETLRDRCESLRDLAMIDLLASTGMRVGELVRLNRADIDFDNRECVVLGKGNKERRVAVADAVWERLAVWLEARAGDPCPNVFLAVRRYGRISTGHSITSSAVYQILKTRSSQSGVEDFSPHDLRRTFATRLLGAGTDINLVRKAMGHASVLTTQRYDKREDEEVEEATRKILI